MQKATKVLNSLYNSKKEAEASVNQEFDPQIAEAGRDVRNALNEISDMQARGKSGLKAKRESLKALEEKQKETLGAKVAAYDAQVKR